MTDKSPHSLLNWTFLLILGIVWGGSFMSSKIALTGFGPMTVASLRLVVATVVLVVCAYLFRDGLPKFKTAMDKRIWWHILAMGMLTNAVPFALLNWGQLRVSSGFAGVSIAVVPLLLLPLAHFLVRGDQMTKRKFVGFIIGFIGVVILIDPERFIGSSGDPLEPIARLACVLAACFYAIGTINTRLCPPVSLLAFSAGGLLVGTVMMVPIALYFEGVPDFSNTDATLAIVYLGLFPTALATLMVVYVINHAGPTFMSLVNYQVPVWAILFGVMFLDETLPVSFVTALGLILLGLAISQWKRRTSLPPPS